MDIGDITISNVDTSLSQCHDRLKLLKPRCFRQRLIMHKLAN